jgi:hypothetical protein
MTGGLIALQIAFFTLFASATSSNVSIAGRELHWGCAFRQMFGIPCPNCGMTRSVLLSLHGDLRAALELNPAGPLLLLGTMLFGAAMFLLMFRQQRQGDEPAVERLRRSIRLGTLAYGGLFLLVLLGHWIYEIT